jgi:hypothetical protein
MILLNLTAMKASRHMQTNISNRYLSTLGVSLIYGIKLSDIKQTLQMNISLHLESTNCLEDMCVLYLLILTLTEFSNGQKMKHQNNLQVHGSVYQKLLMMDTMVSETCRAE